MEETRRRLYEQIREWNENRLDLFAISEPNEDLEFFGVMRFYFQDDLQDLGEKVSTKCLRVSSTAAVRDVLAILVEKFRPDIRMLTAAQYALYEVHADMKERRLQDWECPLQVQLNWGKDDREGRIVMKRLATLASTQSNGFGGPNQNMGLNRKLSRREKKELKKKEKDIKVNDKMSDPAGEIYNEFPESVLTRSISNPEMVMRRRRQVKLEKKLQQIRTSEGGPESGGTLKIYGGLICPEVPYKTLLLSEGDRAGYVVKETLEKYGLEDRDPRDYCLVQVITPYAVNNGFTDAAPIEYILNDDDFPLELLIHSPPVQGQVTFHLRRRPPEMMQWTKEGLRQQGSPVLLRTLDRPFQPYSSLHPSQLPYLLEVNADGIEIHKAQKFIIPINGLEVGRERLSPPKISHLLLHGQEIFPRHCVFRYTDTTVTVTCLDRDAIVCVNNSRIFDTIILRHSDTILLGITHFLRFLDPSVISGRGTDQTKGFVPVNKAVCNVAPNGLPALLQYAEDSEDRIISALLAESSFTGRSFRFVTIYTIYMASRYLVEVAKAPVERIRRFLSKISEVIFQIIQKHAGNAQGLALWMADTSELLNFFSHDRDLNPVSTDARDRLARGVQLSFTSLIGFLRADLNQVLPAFLDVRPDAGEVDEETFRRMRLSGTGPTVHDIIDTLGDVMSLLIRAQVNAALTIQLFSQLFHHINQWLFNRIVHPVGTVQFCTRDWGRRLAHRLRAVETWAEHQGLELAAACHLARIIQAAHLLQSSKVNDDDIAEICSSCFKLNSLQIGALLQNYVPARDEPRIAQELIRRAVIIAQNTADESARNEGLDVTLNEDVDLNLPFLLPEDGYSCESVRGLPNEVAMFIKPLSDAGLCRLLLGQPESTKWTVYFTRSDTNEPQSLTSTPLANPKDGFMPQGTAKTNILSFRKINNSLGLSIVAAMGDGQTERSIYVKSVVPNGAAAADGRIQAGDLLLEVDGQPLRGLTQEAAAAMMGHTGPVVTLKVIHQGAVRDGLAMLLKQSSPASSSRIPAVERAPEPNQMNAPLWQPNGASGAFQSPPKVQAPPSGGHYGKLTNQVTAKSKSTSNLDKSDGTFQVGEQGPTVTLRRATHNLENRDPDLRESKQTGTNRQSGTNQLTVSAGQYPYMSVNAPRSKAMMLPPGQGGIESDPRNSHINVPGARIHQPITIQVPRSNVSRPYSTRNNQESDQDSHQLLYPQPVYSQPHAIRQPYTSQPNLSRATNDSRYPDTYRNQGHMFSNNPGFNGTLQDQARAQSVGPNLMSLPVTSRPSAEYEQQLREERQHQLLEGHRGRNSARMNQNMRSSALIDTERNNNKLNVDVQNEPQYAKIAPRGPRSQSVPRLQQPRPASSSEDMLTSRTVSSASPWVREERELELKRLEKERQLIRDEEIRSLESLFGQLSHDESERLRRLKLEADFDRRLDEVSNRGDDPHYDDTEMTAAGRASLVRMMQEDLRQRRADYEQKRQSEERQREQQRSMWPDKRLMDPAKDDSWNRELEARGYGKVEQGNYLQPPTNNLNPANYAPLPPERKSSYDVYRGNNLNGGGARVQQTYMTPAAVNKKTVSFNASASGQEDPLTVRGYQKVDNPALGNFRNPNFGKPSNAPPVRGSTFVTDGPMYGRQNSSAPSTPGVVGTQELYRDPRDRRLAENRGLMEKDIMTPERMSFRDKMKHFAAEAGEDTPAERARNSRAQRVLEADTNER